MLFVFFLFLFFFPKPISPSYQVTLILLHSFYFCLGSTQAQNSMTQIHYPLTHNPIFLSTYIIHFSLNLTLIIFIIYFSSPNNSRALTTISQPAHITPAPFFHLQHHHRAPFSSLERPSVPQPPPRPSSATLFTRPCIAPWPARPTKLRRSPIHQPRALPLSHLMATATPCYRPSSPQPLLERRNSLLRI